MRKLLAVLLLVAACGDDGPSRSDAMAAVAADVAVPRFEAFATAMGDVTGAVDVMCASPSESSVYGVLEEIDSARRNWLLTQAVWTGPVMERRSTGLIDWTVDSAGIDELVAGSDELTAELITEQVGSDNRGLRAVRSVLDRGDAVELLGEQRWCDYVASTVGAVADEGRALRDEWRTFAAEFAGDDVNDWLSMLVNDSIQTVKATTTEPSTEGDAPVADPAGDRVAQLEGVANVTAELGPLLGTELQAQLQDALGDAIGAYQEGQVTQGRELATEAERLLTADVAGQLGVTVGFSDADGDGSG